MVVRMMKWRPWPPLSSRKLETKIFIHCIKGLLVSRQGEDEQAKACEPQRLVLEIKWRGSKGSALSSFRRSVRRNYTKEEALREDGVIEWNEEFQSICNFSVYKEGLFNPWEVEFSLFSGLTQGAKKIPVVASALLNLGEYASVAEEREIEISLPLSMPNHSIEISPILCFSLRLLELRTGQQPSEIVQRSVALFPRSPCSGEVLTRDDDEIPAIKAGFKKVKIFKALSTQKTKKACHEEEGSDGKSSVRSEDIEQNYPFDTDSFDDMDEGESSEGKDDSAVRKSFNYGTLAYVNHAGGSLYSNTSSGKDEDWIYYSHQKSDARGLHVEESTSSDPDQSLQNSKRRILPWKKRKLSFRSPKTKGEPLLKKDYGDEGGDDIDFDRRQLSSSDESTFRQQKSEEDSIASHLSASEFGDDNFAVGSWEKKEFISRDGHMKLQTQVFFASIDQRSERAAGESACTALVAVIADWFQSNLDEMPIKSQLDSLIREGSLKWRNLCENEAYRERFPDKHFDLETVLQAKICPLAVVPEKSFIGFFPLEGLEEGECNFLQDAMSFDSIWDNISQVGSDTLDAADPFIYIVSWNDHFFILKVERDAYYIIDTLGERLYEGCNQAYILKFDKDTTIQQLPSEKNQSSNEKLVNNDSKGGLNEGTITVSSPDPENVEGEGSVVCRGKESCKEYIKSFLAAIPIRELQADLKKGLRSLAPLHHRLQVEFHYTERLQPAAELTSVEPAAELTSVETRTDALEVSSALAVAY